MPIREPDSMPDFLAAMKWPLYQERGLADLAARMLLDRMVERRSWKLLPEDFQPVSDFLLHQSKADPDILSQRLSEMCCGETNLASIVLWTLNASKDSSSIAQKSLELFSTSCDKSKELFQKIEAGQVSKEEAYDKPIQIVYQRPVQPKE
jgi:hypothetical protein